MPAIVLIEPHDRQVHTIVLILSAMMLLKAFEVIEFWIQAHHKARISSIMRLTAFLLSSMVKIVVVLNSGSLLMFAGAYVLDVALLSGGLLLAYFRTSTTRTKWRVSLRYAKGILARSWWLILSGLMVTFYMRVDQVMLGFMMPSRTEVGIYSAAAQVAGMWYFAPNAIIVSFNPILMRKKKSDASSYLPTLQLLYSIVAWMGISVGVIVIFSSNLIVSVLFGADYAGAAGILSISIWAGTFAMLGAARSSWLICEGLQKYSLVYIAIGAGLNITLNCLLIPWYGGYGAALATLATQVVVAVVAPMLFQETRVSSLMILKACAPRTLVSLLHIKGVKQ